MAKTPLQRAIDATTAGDLEGAVRELSAGARERPRDAAAWLALGVGLGAAGRSAEAVEACERAVELDASLVEARLELAGALHQARRGDDARRQLDEAARLAPADVRPLRAIAARLQADRRFDEALAVLERARALAPGDGRTWYAIGLAEEGRRDPAAAVAAYRRALALDAGLADARRTLADLYAQLGEHELAIEVLDDLVRLGPDGDGAAKNRGVLVGALASLRARRLLGADEVAIAASALVREGALRPLGQLVAATGDARVAMVARWRAPYAELLVGHAADGASVWLLLALPHPKLAAQRADDAFGVTVVGRDGALVAVSYADAASLTFLREALGCPLTQATEAYARLLSGEPSVERAGARVRFATVALGVEGEADRHGLLVER